jgi:subtilisin-like proprotein convertase family protein
MFLRTAALAALATLTTSIAAHAAVPVTVHVAGALRSQGGGPVTDGNYDLTFVLYKSLLDLQPAWKEGPVAVAVQGGGFDWVLGSKTPLDAKLAAGGELHFGVQVGNNPVLSPVPLHSVVFAWRALAAEGVDCSGCITAQHLDPKLLADYAKKDALAKVAVSGAFADLIGGPDLSGYAKADSLAAYAKVTELADVAKSGAYADLKGAPTLPKLGTACGTGLVMKGIKQDGSYDCVQGGVDPSSLPPDGLDEISNGLLTNQFVEVAASPKAVPIPDNNGDEGMTLAVDVPDFGVAQNLTIAVDIENSDLSKLQMTLTDPNGKGYVLCDPCGKKTDGALKTVFPDKTPLKNGDLGTWKGQNPKGTWKLFVKDFGFLNNKEDGKVNSWGVQVATLSSKKVAANGVFIAKGGFKLPVADKEPFACDAAQFGATFASPAQKTLVVCNGVEWAPILLGPIGTQSTPGGSCADILAKSPFSKDGLYWVDPDALGPTPSFQAYCDMSKDGGGWTLVWSNLRGGSGKPMTSLPWTKAIETTPIFMGALSTDLEKFVVYTGLKHWKPLSPKGEIRYTWANAYGSAIDQAQRCTWSMNAGDNYRINFTNCAQLVGSQGAGLFSYHNNRPFTTYDADHDADGSNCSTNYSNSPWWYGSCWDGNINGGGEGGNGHQNAAYWSSSQNYDGQDNGTGGGNGWIWVR